MNAEKYAWQIVHAEIRRRAGTNKGLELDPQLENIGVVLRRAQEDDVSSIAIILELAGFAGIFQRMFAHAVGEDSIAMAAEMGRDVMARPDSEDDEE